MFFKSKKIIGLDIGTTSIKAAEAEVTGRGVMLQSFAMIPTPQNSLVNGDITDSGAISSAISNLVMELRTKNKNCAIGLWGSTVIVKKLTTPKIQQKLIDQQIRWEAEQYIPFDINTVSIDYHILPNSSSPDTMDVILVAAQNEVIFQYSEAIQLSGLNNSVIDVSGFGLANAFEANYGKMTNETIGLLNIGASITNFVVVHRGEVIFSRDIPAGGANYTNEIHKELGITLPEAEALKLNAVQKKEVPDEVHSVISATTENIGEDFKNSLEFFNATASGISLTRCFVTGGGSQLTGLIEFIGKIFNVPVEKFDPFLRVKFNPKKIDPHYIRQINPYVSVVMGLAMRQAGDR